MTPNPTLYLLLLVFSGSLFCYSCVRRFSLIAVGLPEERKGDILLRAKNTLMYAFAQKRVAAKPFGVNHVIIFWSFMILLVANVEFLVKGFIPGASLELLPGPLYHGLLLTFDLVSSLVLLAVAVAAVRRAVSPPFDGARTAEAFVILGMITLLMVANFGLHGAEISLGWEKSGGWMPVSSIAARLFSSSTLAPYLVIVASVCWWLHAVVLLAFMNYLPLSKHMHILTAIPNCFLGSLEQPNTMPRETFAAGVPLGAENVQQLTWKDLFDSFACTECGRCENACPAASTGKPLNPRQVIHQIKVNLLHYRPQSGSGEGLVHPLIGEGKGAVSEDAIWSCTTCGACMAACPVLIEQMPKLVKMRRHLVQMKSAFPEELLNLFENMEQRSNPWGIAPGERTKWHGGMEVKPFEAGKTEYLLFVGCAGAFDARQKHVTVALATILNAAGVSWGILGKDEACCGDSLRRLGNEYVFVRMVQHNVRQFREKGVAKIITQCPHCFSTLKNDYRQFGIEMEVIHHSEMIDRLVQSGRLRIDDQAAAWGKVAFHDSCYLGRHNGVYDPSRRIIAAVTGRAPEEFGRNHENAFCCGGGGGRMWMEEHLGSRINLNRVSEGVVGNPDTLCVSCPYCLTMFEDGLKDLQKDCVVVKDLAEVVAEALR